MSATSTSTCTTLHPVPTITPVHPHNNPSRIGNPDKGGKGTFSGIQLEVQLSSIDIHDEPC